MKIKHLLVTVGAAALIAANPVWAGTKSFKEKVVVEEEPTKFWGAALSTGWDSLYMFRGANVLRGDLSYGSGIYWTDLNVTFNLTDSDSITLGTWVAFGTQKTSYKEFDFYASYTKAIGDLSLSFGYSFYYAFSEPLYAHELNAIVEYTFDFGFMSLTPSVGYYFNLGPSLSNKGFADPATSYLLLKLAASVPIVKDVVSIDPYISYGTNFEYNVDEFGNKFSGANDIQVGVSVPFAITENISIVGYGAYSYAFEKLFGTTRHNTFWGGGKVEFSF